MSLNMAGSIEVSVWVLSADVPACDEQSDLRPLVWPLTKVSVIRYKDEKWATDYRQPYNSLCLASKFTLANEVKTTSMEKERRKGRDEE